MIKFTLEDLGLEMFHDPYMRFRLWELERSIHFEDPVGLWRDENSRRIMEQRRNILENKRYKKAYDMREQGYVYREIGEALDVCQGRAYEIVQRYAHALKAMTLNRYDRERLRRVKKVKRYKKAYEMRKEGNKYRVIGEAIGVTMESARRMAIYYEYCLEEGRMDGILLTEIDE